MPAAGTLRYSSAGHVPAIVVDADGASRFLTAAGSLPLAVLDDLVRPERDVVLAPGSTLLLYTDGLVERRDQDLDQGMDRAVTAVTEGRHLAPAALAAVDRWAALQQEHGGTDIGAPGVVSRAVDALLGVAL